MKQCAAWQSAGAIVIPRTLRYPSDWPKTKAEQKGIDVLLAIDFVTLAIDGEYDVGVIASGDSDLLPALEYVYHKFSSTPRVEVTCWSSPTTSKRLRISGGNMWCYWLDRHDYHQVADLTDYNL